MTAPWYWLAFPDADAVAIVRGHNVVQAAAAAHREGCNPGGSVEGEQLAGDIDGRFVNRLITDPEDIEAAKRHVKELCPDCGSC